MSQARFCFYKYFAAWIACFAILLGPLASSFSHAQRSAAQGEWHGLCGSTGLVKIFVSDANEHLPASSDQPDHFSHHCPWCCSHGAPWISPPTQPYVALEPQSQQSYPRLFFIAPRTSSVWRAAQPRGPPTHS
ncbi:DUF2946 domain-containing protein [Pollutimonas bauzanensis]|uniref:DUF2946 domain-containing protein n=1 Tax=Pollutimonas bauzanensis TaxID=658167 RepID=UPI0009353680